MVTNAAGDRYCTWRGGLPAWTENVEEATRYVRREDAEGAHGEDEDAWRVLPYPTPVSDAPGEERERFAALLRERFPSSLRDGLSEAIAEFLLAATLTPRETPAAEVERLRATNRELHRRAQKAEGHLSRSADTVAWCWKRIGERHRQKRDLLRRAQAAESRATDLAARVKVLEDVGNAVLSAWEQNPGAFDVPRAVEDWVLHKMTRTILNLRAALTPTHPSASGAAEGDA